MKKLRIAALLVLSLALMMSGCQKAEKKKEVIIPELTEKTIVLEEIDIRVENISPYEGIYIEQGEDENKDRVIDVCALQFMNINEKTIKNATLVFDDGTQELNFYFEMLPYGSSVAVVEYDKKELGSPDLKLVKSEVNYLDEGIEDMVSIELVESEFGVMVLENMTVTEIPKAEIYYRRGYEEGVTLGGLCHKVTVEEFRGKEKINPEAEYWSDKCSIVNILIYPDLNETEQ